MVPRFGNRAAFLTTRMTNEYTTIIECYDYKLIIYLKRYLIVDDGRIQCEDS